MIQKSTTHPFTTDVTIIGAGPVGLFAVFQCGMLGLKCHVVDALDHIGGQCTALYPEKPIYDIPSQPNISGKDLVTHLEEQAAPFKPTYHLSQSAEKLDQTADGWRITTSKGMALESKVVFIAGGAGCFGPNRPPLKNIQSYEGHSVFYSVLDPQRFQDKRIVIAGGGDSAVDWALALQPLASRVMLVHRRDKFRAAASNVEKLRTLAQEDKIDWVVPYQLHELEGPPPKLDAVIVKDLDGQTKALKADILLPFYGLYSNLGALEHWGLELHKKQIKINPATGLTNREGIFAIGDMAHYKGKLNLILTGFSEAARAAHTTYTLVHPDQELHFEHSTTKGIPG